MNQFGERFQDGAKQTFQQILIFLVRLITGVILGLTIALTVQNMTVISHLIFVFIVMLTAALLLRLTRNWGFLAVVILLLVLALVGVLLKLYIQTSAAS